MRRIPESRVNEFRTCNACSMKSSPSQPRQACLCTLLCVPSTKAKMSSLERQMIAGETLQAPCELSVSNSRLPPRKRLLKTSTSSTDPKVRSLAKNTTFRRNTSRYQIARMLKTMAFKNRSDEVRHRKIASLKTSLLMSRYKSYEEPITRSDLRMFYALRSEEAILTGSPEVEITDTSSRPRDDFRELLREMPGFRCHAALASFNIYPKAQNTLDINFFLWEMVQNGFYDARIGNALFGTNVFVLGLAAELYDFLVHVTRSELETAMIDFLVLLHHQLTVDNDIAGLDKLQAELIPSIWARVRQNIGVFDNGEPREAARAATLEHLVQISFMTPWRVDILGGFLTPQDCALLMDENETMAIHSCSQSLKGVLPFASNRTSQDDVMTRGSALLKLYNDWLVYHQELCNKLGLSKTAALEALDRATYHSKTIEIEQQTMEVADLSLNEASHINKMPLEIVEDSILPMIIRRTCEGLPPRRRRLATLKSLLELSSKFFEDQGETGVLDGWDLEGVQNTNGADWFSIAKGNGGDANSDNSHGDPKSEYPLDALPPKYSREQRHGGVIDVATMARQPGEAAEDGPLVDHDLV